MWAPQIPALTGRLRVVRYDHRGHGGSPDGARSVLARRPGSATWSSCSTPSGLGRVHLGGLSLGGMVSMWLAVHAPERVDRLALLCTSAKLGPPSRWDERAATVRAEGRRPSRRPSSSAGSRPQLAAALSRTSWPSFEAMMSGIDAEGYASCCEAIGGMHLLPDLHRVQAPSLVIAGAEDPVDPARARAGHRRAHPGRPPRGGRGRGAPRQLGATGRGQRPAARAPLRGGERAVSDSAGPADDLYAAGHAHAAGGARRRARRPGHRRHRAR